jgi:hypothetical protein
VLRPGLKRSARSSAGESGAEADAKTCAGTSNTWVAPALGANDESRVVVDGPTLRARDEPAAIASGTGTGRWLYGICTSACSDG